jgi:hypothetical protein
MWRSYLIAQVGTDSLAFIHAHHIIALSQQPMGIPAASNYRTHIFAFNAYDSWLISDPVLVSRNMDQWRYRASLGSIHADCDMNAWARLTLPATQRELCYAWYLADKCVAKLRNCRNVGACHTHKLGEGRIGVPLGWLKDVCVWNGVARSFRIKMRCRSLL